MVDLGRLREAASPFGFVTLALTILSAALFIGTQHSGVLIGVVAASGLALVALWGAGPGFRARDVATALTAVAITLLLFTTFQMLPLPASLLARLSPHAADIWARSTKPLGESAPSYVTASLDPVATRVAFARGVAYLAVFLASVRAATRREGAARLAVVLAVSALIVGLAAVLHPAFGVHRVFGIYTPNFAVGEKHVSPFLNPNHLAGYLNIGICVSLGLALDPQRYAPRALTVTVAIVLAAIQLWVASRGGVASMVVGVVMCLWLGRKAISEIERRWLLPTIVCACGLSVIALANEVSRAELIDSDTSKIQLARRAITASLDFMLVGCGRGSFESVFSAYAAVPGYVVFTHAENIVGQWLLEWGWPVGGVALALTVFALRPRTPLARGPIATGPWAAIVAVGLQNLADFSSEVPGVMIALAACAGIVVGGTGGATKQRRFRQWSTAPRAVAATGGVLAVVAVIAAGTAVGVELHDDQSLAIEASRDRSIDNAQFRRILRAAILRHPAEPFLPYAGAVRASAIHDERVMPWAERTLELSPIYGPVHLLLARALTARTPSQARLEYRLAGEQAPQLAPYAITEGARLSTDYADVTELIPAPSGSYRQYVLEALGHAIEDRLPATRARLDERILAVDANAIGPRMRDATALVADLDAGEAAPWCSGDRARCAAEALKSVDDVIALDPAGYSGPVLRAQARLAMGERGPALDELTSACDRADKRSDCLTALIELALAAGDTARLDNATARLERGGCFTEDECMQQQAFLGSIEDRRHNSVSALGHFKKALALSPDDDGLLVQCAQIASATGLHVEAKGYYEQLSRKHPSDAQWTDQATREARAVLREGALPQ